VIGAALSGSSTGDGAIALRAVLQSLEQGAKDPRIVGLYLKGNMGAGSGFATLREVRQGLEKFRASGKPIYAYDGETWRERDYYLTSVANHIWLHPTGLLEVNGIGFQTPFFAGALQKYGVGIQVLRVGKYKSAVEPYIRNGSSPEDQEQTRKWLMDLWNEFLNTTAKSRKLTPQKLQAIADSQGLLLADQAKTAGLVDRVAHEDELDAELKKLTGEEADEESFRQISLESYAQTAEAELARSSQNRIAVVYAQGSIISGDGGTESIGGDGLASLLRELRNDESVKAIVLRVNSPGGGATASEMIAREVYLTNKVKPVVASMGNFAASGGYQISAYATRIFASPTTLTGSIGVFGVLPNFQTIANNNGITWDGVKTGRFADIQTISRPKTPEEMAIGQKVVDRIYDEFLTIVSTSRELDKTKVAEIAQGRVWSGLAAKQIGLVDELGGLEDAIANAAKEAKLGDDWELEEYPRRRSLEARLVRRLFQSQVEHQTATDPLTAELQNFKEDFESLKQLDDPRGVYSRLPFVPRIE
jgi:protease-4